MINKPLNHKDLQRMALFEDHVMKWLVTEKEATPDTMITDDTAGTSRLLMKVMTKKLNEKYAGVLNEQQRGLIRAYAFSTVSEDQTSIKTKLSEVKENLVSLVDQYSSEIQHNEYLKNKLSEAKSALLSESLEQVDDSTVTRFMLYSRLRDELESKE